MTNVGCGPAPGGEYSTPLMSKPWLGTCSTVMAAGCAGSAGGSVNIADGTDCASTAPPDHSKNTMKYDRERMAGKVLIIGCGPRESLSRPSRQTMARLRSGGARGKTCCS